MRSSCSPEAPARRRTPPDGLPSLRDRLRVAPEVAAGLAAGRAVVALESTVIAHGLPQPVNFETAVAYEDEVRAAGALPATLALAEGQLLAGLDRATLRALATAPGVLKVSTRDIAPALARRALGATTVAASLEIAALVGIRVFATGGIGGVHRGAERSGDVSADLLAIARHPVCVVCAGAKAILDVPRTLEQLETLGVPIVTFGADEFPAFTVRGSGVRSPYRADKLDEVASIARLRLSQGGGMLVALPVAEAVAVPAPRAEAAVEAALDEAERAGVRGPQVTPFLLRSMSAREEAVLRANVALLLANAGFAARLAILIASPP